MESTSIIIIIVLFFLVCGLGTNEYFRGLRGRHQPNRAYNGQGRMRLVHRGYSPYIRTTPGVVSVYTDYQAEPLYVRFHFDDTLPSYKLWLPIWSRLKDELSSSGMNFNFTEINENINSTPGISRLPMIVKYRSGVSREYKGPASYPELYNWVMAAV